MKEVGWWTEYPLGLWLAPTPPQGTVGGSPDDCDCDCVAIELKNRLKNSCCSSASSFPASLCLTRSLFHYYVCVAFIVLAGLLGSTFPFHGFLSCLCGQYVRNKLNYTEHTH